MKEYDFERVGARELSPEYVSKKTEDGWELHSAEFFPGTAFGPSYYSLVWVRDLKIEKGDRCNCKHQAFNDDVCLGDCVFDHDDPNTVWDRGPVRKPCVAQ